MGSRHSSGTDGEPQLNGTLQGSFRDSEGRVEKGIKLWTKEVSEITSRVVGLDHLPLH